MKLYMQTLGCKVNAVESDSIAALLSGHGYTLCDRPEEAAVIVVNSCTVTASGDRRMHRTLRLLRQAAPEAVIVLTGCYVQAFPEEAARLPECDLICGTRDRLALPALLTEALRNRELRTAVVPYDGQEAFEELPAGTDPAHTRAFLKIQDGCDRFCTYCIIPYARGRARSRRPEAVRAAAVQLRAQGFEELVLCGINLACWGEEWGLDIAEAVQLCAQAGFPRIRLGSLEPDGLTEDVLQGLAAIPALCPQFHIAVQSGCDRTLRDMGRRCMSGDFLALAKRIRALFPEAALTTDLMVGFPGETEADFAETLRFCEAVGFAGIHGFRYSPRPGTAAADFPEQVPEAVKKERADRLHAMAERLRAEWLDGLTGSVQEVLFERERGNGFHTGHTRSFAPVLVPMQEKDGDWRNSLRRIRITGCREGKLLGKAMEEK